ncbi:MAG: 3-hydroxyacyl-ACP dehydratase FabZ [Moritella sp.]|uniref:3-hydroxyacyl-ACP dehydratase FabZ n=1 Tax=Moritella sp. TaxID=78556 RepID=UPI0029BA0395|nr:3-hydroxyacyl-ACP dehydratase FabZ [Moritella sp.]MDX2322549.1 3-hydroxyacyl-ACP dehydratase FabZ [Moritella sp.]
MSEQLNRIEIQEIMELLPHRYPFLLVDRVLDYVAGASLHAVKNVSVNEPQFTGHFPKQPIFPGVLILEALAQASGLLGYKSSGGPGDNELYYFAGIDKARFRKPVVPGDVLHLHVELIKERRGIGRFVAIAKVDGDVVCEAEIMCARRENK